MVTAVDIMEALVGKISSSARKRETIIQKEDNAWITDGQYPFYDFLYISIWKIYSPIMIIIP
jgi:CBS domain containing-hemolysin-like protein